MNENKEATTFDKGDCRARGHEKHKTQFASYKVETPSDGEFKKKPWYLGVLPSIRHNAVLVILGICTWVLLWSAWGEKWGWGGEYFRISIVTIIAWVSGQLLQEITSLPPLLAALLTGILARYFNALDMRNYTHIDAFLRNIYPVIILGKGSLAWDLNYMKNNWMQTVALGVLPWVSEVIILAVMTHLLLGFPWVWGFMLGAFYASVSCPVVMPLVIKHNKLAEGKRNWIQFICTAGGIDTALSVGVFGLLFTFQFYETNEIYRYTKAILAIFVGVILGVSWGTVSGLLPHSQNYYVTELRIFIVLMGGLAGNFLASKLGWGGTVGVAVLACNSTAATFWARKGWKLNNNPASTAYRVFWAFCEPVLFAFTGTFFVIENYVSGEYILTGLGILAICLLVRLSVAFLVCWNLSLKERLFVCCTWIPKSIVEAVLCPVALNAVIARGIDDEHINKYAEDIIRLVVQAILVTTPIGYLFTNLLGPRLLKAIEKDSEYVDTDTYKRKSFTGSLNEEVHR